MKRSCICVVANHKGGVAKTQTTVELAFWLAERGGKVLVIDVDPQGNTTNILSMGQPGEGRYLSEIFVEGNGLVPGDIRTRTIEGNRIDYVPANVNLGRLESRLNKLGKEYIISDCLQPILNHYDYILLDTPPSVELLSLAGLIAADRVLIPAIADRHSYDGVESLVNTCNYIASHERLNPNLKIDGIVVGRYNERTLSNRQHLAEMKKRFGDLVLNPPIRECTRVQQAVNLSLPVLAFDPRCNAARDYACLFDNLKLK